MSNEGKVGGEFDPFYLRVERDRATVRAETAERALAGIVDAVVAATRIDDPIYDDQHSAQLRAALSAVPADLAVRVRGAVIDAARGLDTDSRVRFYEHDFYPLSNFSAFPLRWPTDDHGGPYGTPFLTSEHVYHWEKFRTADGNDIARQIRTGNLSAHEAFKLAEANKAHRREDWDVVKVDIMRRILRAKVDQHEYVRRKLLATGDRELVEDSWRDDFWGWGPNRDGRNQLGKLWMEIRAELRSTAP